jgi:ferredoxin
MVTVMQGADTLESPSAREAAVLARNGAAPNERLSCQCEPAMTTEVLITTGYW